MTGCFDDGRLRAALDGELPAEVQRALQGHLAVCSACRARSVALQALAEQSASLISAPTPDVSAAFVALRQRIDSEQLALSGSRSLHRQPLRRSILMSSKRVWRPWMGWVAALVALTALLVFPPVRAIADQLLNVFRVQNVVFVPVSSERMEQLRQLNIDEQMLFLTPPKQTGGSSEIRPVASLSEAAALVGFTPAQPTLPRPPSGVEFAVTDRATLEFQVNVETARDVLRLAGVTDVTLPDALGAAPIVADVPPVVSARYSGDGYEIVLMQGTSPQVTLPDGVDMQQLGYAALRLLGMEQRQAAALAAQIDWRTTLVFPFPADITSLRQVSIGGSPGLLMSGQSQGESYQSLYWQRGERFYVLSGRGVSTGTFLEMAEAMR